MSEDLLEYITSISLIKAFSSEENRTKKVIHNISDYFNWVRKMLNNTTIPMTGIKLLSETGMLFVIILGSILLKNNEIPRETFIMSLIFANMLVNSFQKITSFHHTKIMFEKTMSSIHSVLGTPLSSSASSNLKEEFKSLQIDNLSFAYTPNEYTLRNISLNITPNTMTALIGTSGSGKTTIANLLLKFNNNYQGKILINGHNYETLSEKNINNYFGIIQQDTFFFNMTISDNLRIGNAKATDEELIQASQLACIHDQIIRLPNGYQTMVGNWGQSFLVEKQRLSIARMILKDAPILILDEATSAIDPYNEYLIQRAIDNLKKDKTIIVIAHHLHTIRHADQIVVLNNGQVDSIGDHNDLLHKSDLYKTMISEQDKVDIWTFTEKTQ